MVMDALNDEMLRCVLEKLDVSDAVRALSVCKRWKETIEFLINTCHFHDRTTATIHCPLIFIRDSTQHWWYGYDSTTCKWVPLPPLRVQMQVSLCPLAGEYQYYCHDRLPRPCFMRLREQPFVFVLPECADTQQCRNEMRSSIMGV